MKNKKIISALFACTLLYNSLNDNSDINKNKI